MGLPGFRKAIKEAKGACLLRDLAGKILGVDTFVPLHKYAVRHAHLLASPHATEREKGAKLVSEDYRNWVIYLHSKDIRVVSVLDGGKLTGKVVNQTRQQRIAHAQAAWTSLMLDMDATSRPEDRDTAFREEVKKLEKQIATVTEDVVIACLCELRRCGLCYIRAPYEADAQLAYMARKKIIDVVYSEDSDLIIHGVDHVVFGLNFLRSGWCYSVTQNALSQFERIDNENPLLHTIHAKVKSGWSVSDVLVPYSILMGCVYMPKVRGCTQKRAVEL